MPSKYIDAKTWESVEREYVVAVQQLQRPIKEVELVRLLILKGIESMKSLKYEEEIQKTG